MTTVIHSIHDYQNLVNHLSKLDLQNYCTALMVALSALSKYENPILIQKLEESKLPFESYYAEFSLSIKETIKVIHLHNDVDFLFTGTTDLDAVRYFVDVCSAKVLALLRGVIDTSYIICKRLPSRKSCEHFFNRMMFFCFIDKMEQRFKYHSNYLLCSLLPDTEPPKNIDLFKGEVPGVIIGGWIRRFFLSKSVDYDLKVRYALSLQNCKRAALSISRYQQLKAVVEHQNSMLGNDYKTLDNEGLVEIQDCLSRLTRTYYRKLSDEDIPNWRLPSVQACFESRASNLGAYGYFCDEYKKHEGQHFKAAYLTVSDKPRPGESLPSENIPEIGIYSAGFDFNGMIADCKSTVLLEDQCHASYSQILEPFKVRGITKGMAKIYQLGRLIQKPMHNMIRDKTSVFRFVGMRHNPKDINEVYKDSILWSKEKFNSSPPEDRKTMFTYFVSGDYTKATDNMHPSLPETFIKSIALNSNLSGLWVKVLRLTLGPHILHYPDLEDWEMKLLGDQDYHYVVKQKFGQLMGSPTSFPVLCLVNAAILWASVEEYLGYHVSWKQVIRDFRPMINGDDICFLSNPEHYAIWKRFAEMAGLSLSPGKNYCSINFVNINSTTYWVSLYHDDNDARICKEFKQIYVSNPGLLKGQAKVLNDDSANPFKAYNSLMPICDQLDELLVAASLEENIRTTEIFFNYLKHELKGSHRCYFLPRLFGGLGLTPDKPFEISKAQMCVALLQLENYRDLSDIPLKYQFNEFANKRLENCLDKNFLNYFYDIGNFELAKPKIHGVNEPISDASTLPNLSIFEMDKNYADQIFKRDKKGKITKKRKEPEDNFIKLKKKALKKQKLISSVFGNYTSEWLYENIFKGCNLQPTTCTHDISVVTL